MKKLLILLFFLIIPATALEGNMSDPYIEGSFIKSVYPQDVVLWTDPYFVWGNYQYNESKVTKACTYFGNNTFACDYLSGHYLFNMSFANRTEYNATGQINYTTSIYFQNDVKPPNMVSQLPSATRESTLSDNFMDYLWLVVFFIVGVYILSFGDKRKYYKPKER